MTFPRQVECSACSKTFEKQHRHDTSQIVSLVLDDYFIFMLCRPCAAGLTFSAPWFDKHSNVTLQVMTGVLD